MSAVCSGSSVDAHHLGALVSAGVATREKRGRETLNRADFGAMRRLLGYVEAGCCAGVAAASGDAA